MSFRDYTRPARVPAPVTVSEALTVTDKQCGLLANETEGGVYGLRGVQFRYGRSVSTGA